MFLKIINLLNSLLFNYSYFNVIYWNEVPYCTVRISRMAARGKKCNFIPTKMSVTDRNVIPTEYSTTLTFVYYTLSFIFVVSECDCQSYILYKRTMSYIKVLHCRLCLGHASIGHSTKSVLLKTGVSILLNPMTEM